MKIVNLHVFDAFQKLFTFIFEKNHWLHQALSRYQYDFTEMMKKKIVPYIEKIKNIYSKYSVCSQNRSQFFFLKTPFTSCIIEVTISLGHKSLYLRKSIRIQGFCWLYIEFFIISIQYHFIHVQKKMTAKLKQLF